MFNCCSLAVIITAELKMQNAANLSRTELKLKLYSFLSLISKFILKSYLIFFILIRAKKINKKLVFNLMIEDWMCFDYTLYVQGHFLKGYSLIQISLN